MCCVVPPLGIYLTQTMPESSESAVVQEYIARPLTISGYKFDLRLYMLITDMRCSVEDMPRVFLHHEGLVRFCTTEYVAPTQGNMDDNTIHLSNYSVNKWSSQFVKETGVKEHLKSMSQESKANGGLLPRGGQYRFGGTRPATHRHHGGTPLHFAEDGPSWLAHHSCPRASCPSPGR